MEELKIILGTTSRVTIQRNLKSLGYYSSCSHRGKYYTLKETARFDERGIWFYNGILFSQYGTLLRTIEAFVNDSQAGLFVQDLDNILQTSTKLELLKLVRMNQITRERVLGLYLYCSIDISKQKEQIKARNLLETELILSRGLKGHQSPADEIKAAIILFLSLLDEKQRRLYSGLESLRYGYGGDRKIADLLSMDVHTISQGRKELLSRDIEIDKVRQKGGGRKSIKKNA